MPNQSQSPMIVTADAQFPLLETERTMRPVRSPLKWMGGKWYSSAMIVERMPEHHHYVEVFGGAGHVLCRKAPSALETFNDIDEHLINFFRVCRDRPQELVQHLALTPYSRAVRERLRLSLREGTLRQPDDIVTWAAEWFTLVRQSFSGGLRQRTSGPGWGFDVELSARGMAKSVSSWLGAIDLLLPMAARLRIVQIECSHFRDLIPRYDREGTLFYCDPPYFVDRETYIHDFSHHDHDELAALLADVRSMVMLSYREHARIRQLYPADAWHIESRSIMRSAAKVGAGGKRPRDDELLLTNFNPATGERLQ